MRNSSIEPDVLAGYDDEHDYIRNRGFNTRRVKIEKFHTWTVRIVPAQLGPNKRWYARIGRHWINGRPYTCKQETSPDFGGDPNYSCPMCKMAHKYSSSSDAEVVTRARRSEVVPQWLVYALVFEQDNGREIKKITAPERWKSWEFWLYQSQFDLLFQMVKKGRKEDRMLSILDWRKGNNLFVTAAKKGLTFDKDDQSPLSKHDDRIDEISERILEEIKLPDFQILNKSKTEEALEKLEYYLVGKRSRRGDDEEEDFGSSRRRSSEDEEEEDNRPSRRTVDEDEDERPRSRSRDEDEDSSERHSRKSCDEDDRPKKRRVDEDEDRPSRGRDEDDEDQPKKRRVDDDDEEDDRPRKRRVDEDEDDGEDDKPRSRKEEEEEEDDIPYDDPPSKSRDDDKEGEDEPRDKFSLPPAAAREKLPPSSSHSKDDDDDDVPEEDNDPAPPAKAAIDDDEDPPPAVKASGNSSDKLSERIRSNISRMNKRE